MLISSFPVVLLGGKFGLCHYTCFITVLPYHTNLPGANYFCKQSPPTCLPNFKFAILSCATDPSHSFPMFHVSLPYNKAGLHVRLATHLFDKNE